MFKYSSNITFLYYNDLEYGAEFIKNVPNQRAANITLTIKIANILTAAATRGYAVKLSAVIQKDQRDRIR